MVGTGGFEPPRLGFASHPLQSFFAAAAACLLAIGVLRGSAVECLNGSSRFARGKGMVGTGGFEPPTPCTPSKCATRLRHVPTGRKLGIFGDRVFAAAAYQVG